MSHIVSYKLILNFYKKLRYNLIFLVFYKSQQKSTVFYKIIPKLLFPLSIIDFKKKFIKDKYDKLYFNYPNRLYLYSRGLKYRYDSLLDEYNLKELLNLKIHRNDLIIDCGANVGEFSRALFKLTNNNNIICFEPDPSEFKILEKNCDFSNLEHQMAGLSNVDDSKLFYLNNITGDSSIISENSFSPKITIKTLRLDNFINKYYKDKTIGLLKIEAEGYEPEVIDGCEEVFNKIKYITIDCGPERNGETTFKEINNKLVLNNFSLINFNSIRKTLLYSNNNFI